jgi:hypothetical protein
LRIDAMRAAAWQAQLAGALPSDATHQQLSTSRHCPGIPMDVHPGHSFKVDRLAPISCSGLVRVNNPNRSHAWYTNGIGAPFSHEKACALLI